MPLHHLLPATYLGLFSRETILPRRGRKLFAGERRKCKVIEAPAAKLGRVRDFYTLAGDRSEPELIDRIWSEYEVQLAEAILHLIDGSLDAITWARTLVPFVACLLIRGPDFDIRFDQRIRDLGIDVSEDNTHYARILELQRLLGPASVAEWILCRVQGEGDLVTNDLGFTPFRNGSTGQMGISIPVGHRNVLQIIPTRSRRIAVARDGEWFPRVRYVELSQGNHRGLNTSLGTIAQRFVFGPDESIVREYLYQSDSSPPVPEPFQVGFISGPLAVVHEFTWHRLVSVLSKHPDSDDACSFELDWEAIASGWAPPVYLPTNFPEFPPSLTRKGNVIEANFYEVEGLTN